MKKRNIIFDHLRALSMLGVVAIHVGDLVMQSGTPWNWLYLLCEVLSRYRIESMFIPFNPEFQRSLNKCTLLEIEEQIILNFLFGMVTLKGYKLAMKYLEQKNKTVSKNQ